MSGMIELDFLLKRCVAYLEIICKIKVVNQYTETIIQQNKYKHYNSRRILIRIVISSKITVNIKQVIENFLF